MRINNMELKYNKKFGSYFGTIPAEKYDTGKNHFIPKFRTIYVSSEMYPGTDKSFFYVTSSIHGKMRLYRHKDWFETDVANIFASGKTLREAVSKFKHNLTHLIYNISRNPGTNWHVNRADELREERHRYTRVGGPQWDRLNERVLENKLAADASRRLGMKNPKTDWKKYKAKLEARIYAKDKGHRWTIAQLHSFTLLDLENIASFLWKKFRRRANPGTNWHSTKAREYRGVADSPVSKRDKRYFNYIATQEEYNAKESAKLGMLNPTRRKGRNPDKGLLGTLVFCTAVVLGVAWLGKRMSG